jgi:hypothetical protein
VINAGVERVVYDLRYRAMDGIDLLEAAGIQVDHYGS